MKKVLYILLVCVLLAACASDDMEAPLSDRVSSLEISTVGGYGTSTTGLTYTFEYDAAGRLKKVNDKAFYYGANGRVEYSRIERKVEDEYRNEEYIERLSYHWDTQGRLNEVRIDSLYQRYIYFSEQGAVNSDNGSMVADIVLARFSYEGIGRKPSSIKYRKMSWTLPSRMVYVGEEEEVKYFYDGANVVASQLTSYLHLPLSPMVNHPYTPHPFKMNSSYTYLINPHHLAKIYTQLGFHPYNLREVVSAHTMATSKVEVDMEGVDDRWTPPESGDIRWTDLNTGGEMEINSPLFNGKTTYSYRFNALELPTEIVGEGDGTMQRTVVTYE
ncbi:RHS repeat protein [Sphingobacterium sp. DN00404]|uniref:RHS repeat protein n=1 Tax=Sphingobacterium micropteri TaxID=2763501 RepID=A0ABR7YV82_9SPHI|nr:RHS repeat protein [Sphingobacterium micropteri]MBD1435156.1 RHS repeat protein [Sphingobacterium micropteri]